MGCAVARVPIKSVQGVHHHCREGKSRMNTKYPRAAAAWFVCLTLASSTTAQVAPTKDQSGWHEIGRQHVLDNAEKDLAFMHNSDALVEVKVCAQGAPIRLRNAEMWMPSDQRQRLWLPLVLGEGRCSSPSKVKNGPQRVTHIAFEYEAMTLGVQGAHLVIMGRKHTSRTR